MEKDRSFYITCLPRTGTGVTDDKLNNFFIRPKNSIYLNDSFEVSLKETIIPVNFHNIPENTYCTLIRTVYHQTKPTSELAQKLPNADIRNVINYMVRFRVKEGYYTSVNELKNEMLSRIRELHQNLVKYLIEDLPHPFDTNLDNLDYTNIIKDLVAKYKSVGEEFIIGQNLLDVERYLTRPKVEDPVAIENNLFFKNLAYESHTHKTVYDREETTESSIYRSILCVNKAVSIMIGYGGNEIIEFPHPNIISPYQVAIRPYDLVFVYIDIIENQIISETQTKLLRIIPLTSEKVGFTDALHLEFKNSEYLRLNTKVINYIHFMLKDLSGNPILFQDGPSPLLLRLHFRPIKDSVLG